MRKTPQPNGSSHVSSLCTLVEELCASPEDQPMAIAISVRQPNLVHRAVLLPAIKKRRTVRGFIKGRAQAKWTGCKDSFAHLV